jgi:heat shock protein HslJ
MIALVALLAVGCTGTTESDEPVEAESADVDIVGVVWQWTETVTPVETITVDDPSLYTLTLQPDGQAQIQADCNSATTSYTLEDGNITFGPMASTLAECGPDSLYDRYLQDIGAAAIYFMDGADLMIDLQMDSGTMRFVSGGAALQ